MSFRTPLTNWCKRWLIRSRDLEQQERQDNADRPPHVAAVTSGKRILLIREILSELEYDDMGVLSLLENGATQVRWSKQAYSRLSSNHAW